MSAPEGPPRAAARDYPGWWLMVECGCGYCVDLLVALLAEQHGTAADLHHISARLPCRRCRERPAAVSLVDRPDRVTEGFGGSKGATILPLLGPGSYLVNRNQCRFILRPTRYERRTSAIPLFVKAPHAGLRIAL